MHRVVREMLVSMPLLIGSRLERGEIVADELTHLIWSNERCAWWRSGGIGYTVIVEEAGRFNRDQALEECRRSLLGWRPGTPYPDIPVLQRDIMAMLEPGELGHAPVVASPASADLADVQAYD
jgi:hypothetical protein